MKCKKIMRLLNMYVDDELPENLQVSLKGHIETCKDCNHKLNEFMKLKELIGTSTQYTANPFLWTRVLEGIREEMPVPIGILVPRLLKAWIPIASILIVISGFILYKLPESREPLYKVPSPIETTVLNIPTSSMNMEKITLNLLVYTNGLTQPY